MKKILTILIITLLTLNGFGQCKNGFTKNKHKINGKKVKLPCIDYSKAEGLELRIQENKSDTNNLFMDLEFINKTDSIKTIYWYDFENSYGIPINFSFSIVDSLGQAIWKNFSWGTYMDSHVFYCNKRYNREIIIEPRDSYKKTIKVWWPGMNNGLFNLSLFYGNTNPIIESNTISIRIK